MIRDGCTAVQQRYKVALRFEGLRLLGVLLLYQVLEEGEIRILNDSGFWIEKVPSKKENIGL